MHADKVEYAWWERKRSTPPLPTTVGDKRNFVLYPAELAEYMTVLTEMKHLIDSEYERARFTTHALATGRVLSWERRVPTLFTITHVLQCMLKLGKAKLLVLNFLHGVLTRRKPFGDKHEALDEAAGEAAGSDTQQLRLPLD